MLKVKKTKTDKGRSLRFTLFHLLSLELGMHEVNGTHFGMGIGIGPLEISGNLHRWDKW